MNREEASQYSLFRKPIEQLVNDNSGSTISYDAQINLNILSSIKQKAQEDNANFLSNNQNRDTNN